MIAEVEAVELFMNKASRKSWVVVMVHLCEGPSESCRSPSDEALLHVDEIGVSTKWLKLSSDEVAASNVGDDVEESPVLARREVLDTLGRLVPLGKSLKQ